MLHYIAGNTDWMLAELDAINRKTWKIMTMHHCLHPRSGVDRKPENQIKNKEKQAEEAF